jgi:cell division septal protein FtsQ
VATTAAFSLLVLFVFSPLARVETVVWTGHVTLEEGRYKALESMTLGRSLWLLSERRLRTLVAADPDVFTIEFRRHPPHTLEVLIEPRDAVARLATGDVVDPQGRIVRGVPVDDLPLLTGIDIVPESQRVDAATTELLRALHEHLPTAAVRLRTIAVDAEGWLLTLAETGTRVRVGDRDVAAQIEKLRVYEQSLTQGQMPPAIDLRWRGQIVVERQPGGEARVRG